MTTYKLKVHKKETASNSGLLNSLDAEQKSVVQASPGPMLVVAGAGTGKTRALTHRVAHLLRSGVDPESVLLCTFTNRAAREMVARVEALSGVSAGDLWAGTFHHVANRLLREHGEAVGLSSGFSILDREDAKEILTGCVAALGERLKRRRLPRPNVFGAIFSTAANCQISLEEAVTERYYRFKDQLPIIEEVAQLYSRRKAALNAVDFDDLLLGWLALMTRVEGVASQIGQKFQHVLVDEYQDVNPLQARIVDEVALQGHGNLTVVGDDAQSIYSFRGASVDLMLRFHERYPEVRTKKLQTNYRSTSQILELANRSIENNANRLPKVLRSQRGDGKTPVCVVLGTVDEQSLFVCQRLLELHQEEGIPLQEMAVLYRAHSHSMELQVELGRRGIPFSVRSGLRFFEQAHIKDVLSYFRVLHNPADELALTRVFGIQRGVGRVTGNRVLKWLRDTGGGASSEGRLEQLLREMVAAGSKNGKRVTKTDKALLELAKGVETMRQEVGRGGVKGAMEWLVEEPYKEYAARSYPNAEERLEDIRGLAGYAVRYGEVEPFLSDLSLAGGLAAQSLDETRAADEDEDRLVLSTVHQAKGLEWRVVFVIWLSEGKFPSGLALRDPHGEEEERRLFHVAVTRAKDDLYMCRPVISTSPQDFDRIVRPSRFLTELQPDAPYEIWDIEIEAEEED